MFDEKNMIQSMLHSIFADFFIREFAYLCSQSGSQLGCLSTIVYHKKALGPGAANL